MFLFESDALFLRSELSSGDFRVRIQGLTLRNYRLACNCFTCRRHRGDGLNYDRGVVGSQRGTLQHMRALGSFVR